MFAANRLMVFYDRLVLFIFNLYDYMWRNGSTVAFLQPLKSWLSTAA